MSDYNQLLLLQKSYFQGGATHEISFRKKMLKRLYEYIVENEEKINKALYEDLHKSKFESYLTEVGTSLKEISDLSKHLKKWSRPVKARTPVLHFLGRSYIVSDPYGQNLIISPWNYPFLLAISPLAGAIAAGNTIILKPSELAPATEKVISEMVSVLFDEKYVACITGGPKVSQELLKINFDHIFFTGSPKVGKIVMEAASKNLTPVSLELGGKSPVVVDETANIDLTARRIAWGKLLNGGQTCIAPDYLLVHESVKTELTKRLIFYFEKFYGKDAQKSNDYPRIINEANFMRLKSLLKNVEISYGGKTDLSQKYISPTLVDEPPVDSLIMQEEIFGPLLPVLSYKKIEQAIKMVNSHEKPLALYVFTTSLKNKNQLLKEIPAGNGAVNDTVVQFANPYLPFGGVGPSGMGAYHGRDSYKAFSHQKSIFQRSNLLDLPMRYAPFKNIYSGLIRKLLK